MRSRQRLLGIAVVGGFVAAYGAPQTGLADDGKERHVTVRLAQQFSQEDNLYRLPAGIDPALLIGPDARRDDLVSSSSIALAGDWTVGEHGVLLDSAVIANRFDANGDLANTAGHGALDWNWQFGHRWSGQIGGRRDRSLAGFADTTSLDKDVLDSTLAHGEARFALGSRWQAIATARGADTSHDNDSRRRDDVEVRGESFGVEYRTPSTNTLRVEYRRARATFPEQALGVGLGSPSDYEERGANVKLGYLATAKVLINANIGELERTYELAPRGDFSGGVWSMELRWSPSATMQIAIRRFRELKAHLDAESDHFVADGSAVTATWLPIDKLSLSLQGSREQQRYIGAELDPLLESRHDTPLLGSLRLTYAPRERATFEVAYRDESRDSNRQRFAYDAAALSVSGEVKF